MQRKVTLLMVVVILLGLLVGCQTNEAELSVFELTLSDADKDALITTYYTWREKQPGHEAVVNWAVFSDLADYGYTYYGYRYYGTFGDCVVWFKSAMIGEPTELEIAGSVFSHPFSADFRVCCNGAYYSLQQAYEQGLISEKDVAVVAKRHAEYNAAVTANPLDSINVTPEMEQDILNAYRVYHNHESTASLDWLDVRGVWCYRDMYAVYIEPEESIFTAFSSYDFKFPKDSSDGSFQGYYLFRYSLTYGGNLYIYNNNSLYTLEEAYDAGVLTNAHLDGLVESYK